MRASELTPFGLSTTEAKTYLAALELGESSVERIAKKARLNRSSIYHTLNILSEKGLVTTAKRGKKTVYIAEDPRKIKEGMEDKLHKFDELLPGLRSIANAIDKKPKITFYEGYDELLGAINDSLLYTKTELLFWFPDIPFSTEYADFWYEEYQPKRLTLGIPARAIGPTCPMGEDLIRHDKELLRRTRLDTAETFQPTSVIHVYGNEKVAIISHQDMLATVIESRQINQMMRSIFESHWASLPESK